MRWNDGERICAVKYNRHVKEPRSGLVMVLKKFLFLPKTLRVNQTVYFETRWLEFAQIRYRLNYDQGEQLWEETRWENQ